MARVQGHDPPFHRLARPALIRAISKAEGRLVDLEGVAPSAEAIAVAAATGKDPRVVDFVLGETTAIVRRAPNVLITRHRLGFTSASAGIDRSNVGRGREEYVLLLPENPDRSAATLRQGLARLSGTEVGVVVSDTHGRPFRRGNVGVAIGLAGIPAVVDARGQRDRYGRRLDATLIPVGDAVASAATMLMGEGDEGRPCVVVRGLQLTGEPGAASQLVRPIDEDLFDGG